MRDMHGAELLAEFDGRLYGLIGEGVTLRGVPARGSLGDHRALSLEYELGEGARPVSVELERGSSSGSAPWELRRFLRRLSEGKGPGFPLVIERSELELPVGGVPRGFTVYTSGKLAHAETRVEGTRIIAICRRKQLASLAFGALDPAELDRVLS
jgi:hypothetical protein